MSQNRIPSRSQKPPRSQTIPKKISHQTPKNTGSQQVPKIAPQAGPKIHDIPNVSHINSHQPPKNDVSQAAPKISESQNPPKNTVSQQHPKVGPQAGPKILDFPIASHIGSHEPPKKGCVPSCPQKY
eukprot:jgi/Botrbrau1/17998/Bobra.0440s0001.1